MVFIVTLIGTASHAAAQNVAPPARPQSTVQIVKDDPKLGQQETKRSQTPKLVEEERPRQVEQTSLAIEPNELGIVVPPAPEIVKRSANSVSIPIEIPANPDTLRARPRYEERAASSVKIGSSFGYRRDPFTRRAKFHSGVDIKARWGDPVGASHAGTVVFAGWYHGYGNLIIVDHGGGVSTYYAHLSSFQGQVGDRVTRGEVVGFAGSTGRATSPHLHYELRIDDYPVNPLQPLALDPSSAYFNQRGSTAPATGSAGVAPVMIVPPQPQQQ